MAYLLGIYRIEHSETGPMSFTNKIDQVLQFTRGSAYCISCIKALDLSCIVTQDAVIGYKELRVKLLY